MGPIYLIKYPPTPYMEGACLPLEKDAIPPIPFRAIQGRHLVVEEKMDGANTGLFFTANGESFLQTGDRYIGHGNRDSHYTLFRHWVRVHQRALFRVLSHRYILYGEWLYAKHTLFYDALPHYFLEFDVWDKEQQCFLDTVGRRQLLHTLPLCSVPVLFEGVLHRQEDLLSLLTVSRYITPYYLQNFQRGCPNTVPFPSPTGLSDQMEGLYIKVEERGRVVARMKWVRPSFLQVGHAAGSRGDGRFIVPNRLCVPPSSLLVSGKPSANK